MYSYRENGFVEYVTFQIKKKLAFYLNSKYQKWFVKVCAKQMGNVMSPNLRNNIKNGFSILKNLGKEIWIAYETKVSCPGCLEVLVGWPP